MEICRNTYEPGKERADVSWLAPDIAGQVRKFHQAVPGYAPTPMREMTELAKTMHVGQLLVKDESGRFGLNAFKGLGGVYALSLALGKLLDLSQEEITFPLLCTPENRQRLKGITFATATDGNHGKGVAWAAGLLGCPSFVYMPKGSSPRRAQAIREAGRAQVTITEWGYDETVAYVSALARKRGWVLVQDTSWPGYEEVPRHIMQGYTTMVDEALAQMDGEAPTHVFLQAGVGAMAGAVTGYLAARYGEKLPKIILVEPYEAACIFASVKAGDGIPHGAEGNGETIMAGLNCGQPCTVAWPILRDYSAYALACGDDAARRGMRVLKEYGIVSGESGASAFGTFLELMEVPQYRAQLGIQGDSRILFFSTEGNTDPESYREIVYGKSSRSAAESE